MHEQNSHTDHHRRSRQSSRTHLQPLCALERCLANSPQDLEDVSTAVTMTANKMPTRAVDFFAVHAGHAARVRQDACLITRHIKAAHQHRQRRSRGDCQNDDTRFIAAPQISNTGHFMLRTGEYQGTPGTGSGTWKFRQHVLCHSNGPTTDKSK